jgi:hypothetical protein
MAPYVSESAIHNIEVAIEHWRGLVEDAKAHGAEVKSDDKSS